MHSKMLSVPLICVCLLALSPTGSGQKAPEPDKQPKITGVRFISFPKAKTDGSVEFKLAIEGENLPATKTGVTVLFETKDPVHPITCAPDPCVPIDASVEGTEIVVMGKANAGTDVTRVRVLWNEGGKEKTADTKDFLISIKENPPKPKLDQFEVKLRPETNKEFPNLHSLVVSKEGGDSNVGFPDNPHRMTVDLMPGGATDVNIVQTNQEQLDVHYVAAADYKPTSVAVTVYDSTDLDTRKATAVAVSKKPEDPNKPKVTSTEIVFISRSHGVGRIRIFGEGFGDDYGSPPFSADDYLWNCLEEFHIRGTDRYAMWVQQQEFDDLKQRIEACRQMLGGSIESKIQEEEKTGDSTLEKLRNEKKNKIEEKDEPALKKQVENTKTNLATFVDDGKKKKDLEDWTEKVRNRVTVSIHSRNPDLQIEKAEILDINDKMIDVYFEFTRYRGYSYPLRLESSTVTIKKTIQKTTQTVKNNEVTATVVGPKEETYSVDYEILPKRDPNLTYKYTVLDDHTANTVLGKGVADNFYVLQLSVVNEGEKKIAIPLAAIQAEVQWIRGLGRKGTKSVSFVQGPSTLAPVPLAAVSSNFEAYQKAKGFRAHLFNALDATTIMATALVPFTGPSVKDATVFFSGGFVPGVHKAWGDLSSQQLQNLTALSWESSETLPAKGGSIEKLVYIAKRSPQFGAKSAQAIGVPAVSTPQIAGILGLEVTGYEVTESTPKPATPATEQASGAGKQPSEGQTDQKPSTPTAPAKKEDKPPSKPKE